MIKVEFESYSVQCWGEDTGQELINVCRAVMTAAGYTDDAFVKNMVEYLANHDHVVLTNEEYAEAMEDARQEEKCRVFEEWEKEEKEEESE